MRRDEVVGLGEMMNFPGIINSVEETHAITGETLKAGKTVTGHFSIPETGPALNAFIASGIRCCHESTRMEDALAKMRLGMYAMFREGSAWHDLQEVSRSIREHEIDTRFAIMISDDAHPYTLVNDGHLDHIVRRAVSFGVDPITAIQMVTINCAQCFQLDHELGSIAPGKCADIVFSRDLNDFRPFRMMIDGEVVAEDGKMLREFAPYAYPESAMHTMHVGETITPATFRVPTDKKDEALVRVIEIIPAHVGDYERHMTLKVRLAGLAETMDFRQYAHDRSLLVRFVVPRIIARRSKEEKTDYETAKASISAAARWPRRSRTTRTTCWSSARTTRTWLWRPTR